MGIKILIFIQRKNMIDFRKIKMFSKLTLIIIAVLFIGLLSCGKDNETSYDGWKYVGDIKDEKGGSLSLSLNVCVYLSL